MRHRALCIFSYIVAAAAMSIMLRIEHLNARAGGRLPNREHRDNDPAQANVKWRTSALSVVEQAWRRNHANADRPLTRAQQMELDSELRRAQANNALHDFVASAGLLQYLLAPAVVALGIVLIRAKRVRCALLPLAAGIVACVMMLWRGYFSSLGW
jgi:hypothetical protein